MKIFSALSSQLVNFNSVNGVELTPERIFLPIYSIIVYCQRYIFKITPTPIKKNLGIVPLRNNFPSLVLCKVL